MKTITIRVSDEEHLSMQAVAARRFMSLTGITRAHFHALAEHDALLKASIVQISNPLEMQKPVVRTMAKPTVVSTQPTYIRPNQYAHLPPVDDVLFDDEAEERRKFELNVEPPNDML